MITNPITIFYFLMRRASTAAIQDRCARKMFRRYLKSALQESLPSVGSEYIARSPLLAADDAALSAARRPPRESARLELDDRIPAAYSKTLAPPIAR
jgi:hypothetical protein